MSSFLKKILAIIIFAGLYYVLERYLKITTAFRYIQFSYAQPVLNFASVVLGPFVGAVASGLGELLLFVRSDVPYDWVSIGCAALNCGIVGMFMIHSDITEGFFLRKDMIRFNSAHFFSGMFCWSVLYPGLRGLIFRADFYESINFSFGRFIGMTVMNFVSGTLLLSLYARSRINAANFYRN